MGEDLLTRCFYCTGNISSRSTGVSYTFASSKIFLMPVSAETRVAIRIGNNTLVSYIVAQQLGNPIHDIRRH